MDETDKIITEQVKCFNRTGMSDERFLDKTDKFLLNDLESQGK